MSALLSSDAISGEQLLKLIWIYKSGCRIKEGSVFQFVEGMINPKRKEKYSNCSPEVRSESDPRFCEVSLDTRETGAS